MGRVYYLCSMQDNRLMNMTDKCNLNKGKRSMNGLLKNAKPHLQFRKETAKTEAFLEASDQCTEESFGAQITNPNLKLA